MNTRNSIQQEIGTTDTNNHAEIDRLGSDLTRTRTSLKGIRKRYKTSLKKWENDWWLQMIDECQDANNRGNIGIMYQCLRKLKGRGRKKAPNSNVFTSEDFKQHLSSVSKDRYETEPLVIEAYINRTKDLRNTEKAQLANEVMNKTPTNEEIVREWKSIKEAAPGEDGIRIIYIKKADAEVQLKVIDMVKFMWTERADKWEDSLKVGAVIPLFKKGDKNNMNNYRGICLLSMGSRILARIIASRLRWWSEHLDLVDDN